MTADGRFGASVADDAVIRFWDLTRGEALESIQCPEGHSGPIAFIGDAFLCSSGDDHAIRVWNVKTGVLLGAAVFLPYVTSLGAGETHIVVGSYDGLGLFRVAGLPEGGKSRFQSPEVAFSPEREAGWGVDYAGIKEVAMETMAAFLRREPPRAAECETVGKWFHSEGVLKEGVRLSLRGGEYFYEVWKAVDRGRAMAFLRGIPRACIPELYYIVVEYPGGSLGLDVSGIFDEATGTTIE